jgi:hypothetical protein
LLSVWFCSIAPDEWSSIRALVLSGTPERKHFNAEKSTSRGFDGGCGRGGGLEKGG